MEEVTVNELKKQHIETYKKSINETIVNNTRVLVFEDIKSLISKPPLASMDSIKNKFLEAAKKNKIVLETNELSNLVDNYRKDLECCLERIKDLREKELIKTVNNMELKDEDTICLYKKDFVNINKSIKKILKDQIVLSYNKKILKNINKVFVDTDDEVKDKIINEINKFMNGAYQKQMFDNLDMKILVKDTILLNTSKENGERYLFTLSNSRLLNLD